MPAIVEEETAQRVDPRTHDAPWYELTRDVEHGISSAAFNLPLGGKVGCRVADARPGDAFMKIATTNTQEAGDRMIEVHSEGRLESTPTYFSMDIQATLTEDDEVIRVKHWQDRVKRELV